MIKHDECGLPIELCQCEVSKPYRDGLVSPVEPKLEVEQSRNMFMDAPEMKKYNGISMRLIDNSDIISDRWGVNPKIMVTGTTHLKSTYTEKKLPWYKRILIKWMGL